MDTLLDALTRWKPFRALVVGDFMLDQHVYGDAERLSADAPVPILHVRRTEHRPGGAANVCLDLVALRAEVIAFGVTGSDAAAADLRASLDSQGVRTRGLIADPGRPTTVKQNLIGLAQTRHPQKMFRVDFESREPVSAEVEAQLLRAFDAELTTADVVCIEDYAKGVCSEALCRGVIERCRKMGKPVFVDPARLADLSRYRHATAMTPNRTEAEFATGLVAGSVEGRSANLGHSAVVAARLLETLELDAAVVTLDRDGALLLEKGGAAVSVPTVARRVYDVTGAGDMFLAGLAAARANGLSWLDSVRFANAAAGLEVEVFGVEPMPFEKVHHAVMRLAKGEGGAGGKARSRDELLVEVAAQRAAGRRIVFTNGCFDILHAGHVSLLERAAALEAGGFLVVGLNSDASVRRLKGPARPVNIEDDRVRVLSSLEAVGAVCVFEEDTPVELIRAVRPDVLVKGGDYTKQQVVGHEVVEAGGGRVELIPLVEGRSTTNVVARASGIQRP